MSFSASVRLTAFSTALFAALTLSATIAHAAAPLTNCTDPGGVLPNGNATCTVTVSNTASSGAGSLRQALPDANAWGNYGNRVAGDSVINVTASGTVTLAGHLPVIFSNVRINGNGLSVSGNNVQRCFFISGLPIEG